MTLNACTNPLFQAPKPSDIKMTPAVTPNQGGPTDQAPKQGIPELRNSKLSEFRQTRTKNNQLSKRAFEESFCRNGSWRPYTTFHRRISHYLSRGPVFPLESHMFLLVVCADFEVGAECLPSDGLQLPGSGLKGRLVVLGLCFGSVIMA